MSVGKVAKHETRKIILKPAPAQHQSFEDHLAVEEPLEIRVHDEPIAVTLRTPGDDFPLVAGFLYSEGLLRSPREIASLRYVDTPDHPGQKNIVNISFSNGHKPDVSRVNKGSYSNGTHGVSGRASIETIKTQAKAVNSKIKIKLDVVYGLGHSLRKAQTLSVKSGGLHAAGVFDDKGTLHTLHEDVMRQNAVDKVIGHMLLQDRVPLDHHILMISGRACFEIIQRAVISRIPIVCAISVPSSLAVELAREFGITLLGFLREDDFNVYTHAERIEI